MTRRQLAVRCMVTLLPARWKPAVYRSLGYRVHSTARVGFSLLASRNCEISEHVTIGHGNVVLGVDTFVVGAHSRIGFLNLFRGGREIRIGRYVDILRRNELNSIPDAETVNQADPWLEIGDGAVITDGHRIDFTDHVRIGRRAILGGRNSSLWTHNRQRTAPISIGDLAYVGSEIRMTPGSSVPDRCIVGIGAVVTDALDEPSTLIAGVPAKVVKPLSEHDAYLVERKTRIDLPDDL